MATAATIRDNARTDLKIDAGKNIWTDVELLRYLNEGLNIVYSKLNFKFEWEDGTITTLTAGTGYYTKPTDLRRMLWAKLYDKTATSTQIDEQELDIVTDTLVDLQETNDMEAQGDMPEYIYEEDNKLWVYPVPNAAAAAKWGVKFKYSKYPADLAGGDTPAFDSRWHHILEWYIKFRAWGKLPGKNTEKKEAYDEWVNFLRMAVADMAWKEQERLTYRTQTLPSKNRK